MNACDARIGFSYVYQERVYHTLDVISSVLYSRSAYDPIVRLKFRNGDELMLYWDETLWTL